LSALSNSILFNVYTLSFALFFNLPATPISLLVQNLLRLLHMFVLVVVVVVIFFFSFLSHFPIEQLQVISPSSISNVYVKKE
jgi:cell division septal protein FtsQ